MEIEHNVVCDECFLYSSVSVIVPNLAWEKNGAYWTFKVKCQECNYEMELEGRIESSIENCN